MPPPPATAPSAPGPADSAPPRFRGRPSAPHRHLPTLAAALLLGLYVWMAASVSREHSTTADEIFHVTAGYSYWKFNDYRLQPENGNLPQRLAALPLLALDLRFPARDQPAWLNADAAEIGHQFFHELGNDLPRMLASARAMIALLGAACGAVVFLWARSLFGPWGGLVGVVLFAFCPHTLAHGGLATSDLAAALGFLLVTVTGWRLLHRVTWGRLAAAGGSIAFLTLSKFSAPLLVPLLGAMAGVRLARRLPLRIHLGRHPTRWRGWRAIAAGAGAFAAAAALAWILVWASFGFRYSAVAGPGTLNHPWSTVLITNPGASSASPAIRPGAVQAVVAPLRDLRLLPEAWLYGLAHVDRFARMRPAFLLGEYRGTGWVEFFPLAFLLKTPLPVFALLAAAAGALAGFPRAGRRRHRLLYRLAPLGLLLAVYGAFSLTSHLNIGHRHILPLYPVLYILAGAVALAVRWRAFAAGVILLLAAHAALSLRFRPHYLAYFNPLLGGPAQAYHHFVDSSLDWGQDLPGLQRWLQAEAPREKIFLSYFGSASPAHTGIRATRIGDGYFDLRGRELLPNLTGGVYCISATMFQQIYTHVRHGWNPGHERRYGELSRWAGAWRAGADTTPRAAAIPRLTELEHLRFGRLCAGLQHRAPDAQIGYSILIFRLTDAEVRTLLEGPPPFLP